MRSIQELRDIAGQRALVRVDFNVPLQNGKVVDDFRIKKSLSSINFLRERGAKVILISHLGKGEQSLEAVAEALGRYIPVKFLKNILGFETRKAVREMADGEVVLLENLRQYPGEQGKDPSFADDLAKLGDFYVNEAFPVSHREDSSIVLVPKLLPAYAGMQFEEEVKNLSKTFKNPERPFLFILGGAKFSTKIPLVEKFLNIADTLFIGGSIASDFLQAQGREIGESLAEGGSFWPPEVLASKKIVLPQDVIVEHGTSAGNKKVSEISREDNIIDVGEQTLKKLESYIKKSKLILFNGPLGRYESGGAQATKKVLQMMAASDAKSIIGGGDTLALVSELLMLDKFYFVSTGGGATLEFLANGTLPGIKALG